MPVAEVFHDTGGIAGTTGDIHLGADVQLSDLFGHLIGMLFRPGMWVDDENMSLGSMVHCCKEHEIWRDGLGLVPWLQLQESSASQISGLKMGSHNCYNLLIVDCL